MSAHKLQHLIKKAREKLGGYSRLAEALGVPRRSLENWGCGHTVPREYMRYKVIQDLEDLIR